MEILIAVVLVLAALIVFMPNDAKEVYVRLAEKKRPRRNERQAELDKQFGEWFDETR